MSTELPLILSLDVAGSPHRWITYEEAAYYYAKDLVAWTVGSSDYTIWGGTSQMTGNRSFLTMNTIIAIKGQVLAKTAHKAHRAPPLTNRALFRRDRHVCAFCGHSFAADLLTRDHVHPMSRGGKDAWTNVVASCKSCNTHKGDRTPEEAKMPLIYVPYAPDRCEYLILMNRRILTDQMEFLMKNVPDHSRLRSA